MSSIICKLALCSPKYRSVSVCARILFSTTSASSPNVIPDSGVRESRSWSITRYHPDLSESIHLLSQALPVVNRPNDVLIRVFASSINPLDIAMARGYGQVGLTLANMAFSSGIDKITYDRLPLSLGRDFVGEVVTLGGSVQAFVPGQVVWGTVPPYYEGGAHADHVLTSDSAIWLAPTNVHYLEAASLPYVGLTAWSALFTFGGLAEHELVNKKCLILGAAGGVGCFAAQLLQHGNARVFATCSEQSMPWLRSLVPNLDQLIDYKDLTAFLRDYRGTFDFILDASTPQASEQNYQQICAWSSAQKGSSNIVPYITLTSPLLRNLDCDGAVAGLARTVFEAIGDTFHGLRHGHSLRWAYYLPNQSALARITELVQQGAIRPFTGKAFPFEQGLQAYQFVDSKSNVNGKVVIDLEV